MVERGAARRRAQDRPLHLAASRSHRGAGRHRRRSRSIAATFDAVTADVLDVVDAPASRRHADACRRRSSRSPRRSRSRSFRRARGRRRRRRGRPRRPLRRDQRPDAGGHARSRRSRFDHERHLGNTLAEIAFEKAGIAKPGVPLVIGRLPAEAAARIAKVAREVGGADASMRTRRRPIANVSAADARARRAASARERRGRGARSSSDGRRGVGHVPTEAIVTGLTDSASGRRASMAAGAAGRRAAARRRAQPGRRRGAGVVSAGHRQPAAADRLRRHGRQGRRRA